MRFSTDPRECRALPRCPTVGEAFDLPSRARRVQDGGSVDGGSRTVDSGHGYGYVEHLKSFRYLDNLAPAVEVPASLVDPRKPGPIPEDADPDSPVLPTDTFTVAWYLSIVNAAAAALVDMGKGQQCAVPWRLLTRGASAVVRGRTFGPAPATFCGRTLTPFQAAPVEDQTRAVACHLVNRGGSAGDAAPPVALDAAVAALWDAVPVPGDIDLAAAAAAPMTHAAIAAALSVPSSAVAIDTDAALSAGADRVAVAAAVEHLLAGHLQRMRKSYTPPSAMELKERWAPVYDNARRVLSDFCGRAVPAGDSAVPEDDSGTAHRCRSPDEMDPMAAALAEDTAAAAVSLALRILRALPVACSVVAKTLAPDAAPDVVVAAAVRQFFPASAFDAAAESPPEAPGGKGKTGGKGRTQTPDPFAAGGSLPWPLTEHSSTSASVGLSSDDVSTLASLSDVRFSRRATFAAAADLLLPTATAFAAAVLPAPTAAACAEMSVRIAAHCVRAPLMLAADLEEDPEPVPEGAQPWLANQKLHAYQRLMEPSGGCAPCLHRWARAWPLLLDSVGFSFDFYGADDSVAARIKALSADHAARQKEASGEDAAFIDLDPFSYADATTATRRWFQAHPTSAARYPGKPPQADEDGQAPQDESSRGSRDVGVCLERWTAVFGGTAFGARFSACPTDAALGFIDTRLGSHCAFPASTDADTAPLLTVRIIDAAGDDDRGTDTDHHYWAPSCKRWSAARLAVLPGLEDFLESLRTMRHGDVVCGGSYRNTHHYVAYGAPGLHLQLIQSATEYGYAAPVEFSDAPASYITALSNRCERFVLPPSLLPPDADALALFAAPAFEVKTAVEKKTPAVALGAAALQRVTAAAPAKRARPDGEYVCTDGKRCGDGADVSDFLTSAAAWTPPASLAAADESAALVTVEQTWEGDTTLACVVRPSGALHSALMAYAADVYGL